jgi:predicted RNA-binding Zn-ribbon protein involved in translation (DUF1610 family)
MKQEQLKTIIKEVIKEIGLGADFDRAQRSYDAQMPNEEPEIECPKCGESGHLINKWKKGNHYSWNAKCDNCGHEWGDDNLDNESEMNETPEEPDYGTQLKNAFKKASKEGNVEAMAYYATKGNTSASVSFEQFKGSWAYDEWLKKPETIQTIQRIQDEMKRFSYLKENKYNQYIQKKKTLLSLAQKLTENMKQTAKKEFGV